jgi:hypothetical protein
LEGVSVAFARQLETELNEWRARALLAEKEWVVCAFKLGQAEGALCK